MTDEPGGRERWAFQRFWHNLFGHPRPHFFLDNGTFCGSCGAEIRSF